MTVILVNVEDVYIKMKTAHSDYVEGIEQCLKALAYTLKGVDVACQWKQFNDLLIHSATVLRDELNDA